MESCQKSPKSFTLVNNVFLHVLILFTILSALFILYISKLTTDGINKEFINIVNNAFSPTELSKLDSNGILKQNLKNIDPVIFSTYINQFNNYPNDLREEINLKIKEEIFIVIGALILCCILINLIPIKFFKYCNGLSTLLLELLVAFSLVGFIEFWFFTNVASKFVPVKPSFLESYMRKKLATYL
jgi:hypothetical protein